MRRKKLTANINTGLLPSVANMAALNIFLITSQKLGLQRGAGAGEQQTWLMLSTWLHLFHLDFGW